MIAWRASVAALAGFATIACASPARRDDTAPGVQRAVVPRAYIVELADAHDTTALLSKIETEAGVSGVSRRLNLHSKVFRGISIQVDNPEKESANKIAALPEVKQMWTVPLIPVPTLNLTSAPGPTTTKNSTSSHHKRQSANATTTWPPHVQTQVDKLRAQGFTGAGYRIGIVDTGIDWTHPALGGCFGPGCLVEYGADLVGNDFNGTNTPVPDDDPFEECLGHGTHVAGIIAAAENERGFTGASPGVKLGMYRTFGCSGTTTGDILLAATIQAYEDGSDIITGSVGGPNGWAGDAFAVAVSRIVDAGVPCTFSAGNEGGGTEGVFGLSSPATGDGVMAISSYQSQGADSAGLVSAFTSWGPTFELELAPSFGSPGGGILSTYPVSLGSYMVASGTSMATPLVASIVALVSQARGTKDPDLIKRLLAATAKPAKSQNYGEANLDLALGPVPQQGAGLVQAFDAAYATSILSTASLSFNDTDNFISETTFTVSNVGASAATYNLSHVPALTAPTLSGIYRNSAPEVVPIYATLAFEPATFTLEPNESADVRVSVTPPSDGLDAVQLPVYSGWVVLNGTAGDEDIALSLPYIGVAGSMRNATVLAAQRIYLSRSDDQANPVVLANTTFQLAAPANHSDWAQPLLATNGSSDVVLPLGAEPDQFVWLVMGSAEVRIEVVPSDAAAASGAVDNGLGSVTLGGIFGTPLVYQRPVGQMVSWNGQLADGSWAPAGRYHLSVYALKISADRALEESWDRYDSPEFIVRYVEA